MPVEVAAELGINCNGSVEIARKLIQVAASAGCDYVKLQKRDIDLVYTKEELESKRDSPWGTTFGEQKRGLEFTQEQYEEIGNICRENRIEWFASPWDINSLKFLADFQDCKYIKIPSPLATNKEILSACRRIDKPVVLSTGMSTIDMVDTAIEVLGQGKIHSILHCTSTYPSKPEELNLSCIQTMRERYPWTKIGFSNHNPGIIFMPIAVALGAEFIEFHVTLDRASYGSDQAASIEADGVFRLMKHIRNTEKAIGDGKKRIYDSEVPIIRKLRR